MRKKGKWARWIIVLTWLCYAMPMMAAEVGEDVRLSQLKMYIGTYRVPYVYETEDDYYVNASFFYNYYNAGLLVTKEKQGKSSVIRIVQHTYYDFNESFRNNLQVNTTLKAGDIVGKLQRSEYKIIYGYKDDIQEGYKVGENTLISVKELQKLFGDEYIFDKTKNLVCLGTNHYENLSHLKVQNDIFYSVSTQLVKPGMTNRQILQAFHDYIVLRLQYGYLNEEQGSSWDPVDAYMNKKGVCESYAKFFKALCERVFIPCELVVGTANGESHMWNRVYIDNKWLYVDCTFDDPIGNKNTTKAQIPQTYFLKTTEEMYKSHYWEEEDYIMSKYNSEWQGINGNTIQSSETYRKYVIAQLVNKKTKFSLKIAKAGAFSGADFINYYVADGTVSYSSLKAWYDSKTNSYIFEMIY